MPGDLEYGELGSSASATAPTAERLGFVVESEEAPGRLDSSTDCWPLDASRAMPEDHSSSPSA